MPSSIGVLTAGGHTHRTEIRVRCSSIASVSEKASTANFVAVYAPIAGVGIQPASEAKGTNLGVIGDVAGLHRDSRASSQQVTPLSR